MIGHRICRSASQLTGTRVSLLLKQPVKSILHPRLPTSSFSTVDTAGTEKPAYKRRESHNVDLEVEYKDEIADIWKEYDDRRKRKQSKIGVVVSNKAAKSISVEIRHVKYYPKYNALIPRHRKIMAHDEEERAREGDIVRIVPCRPRSKMKRHALIDIIRRPQSADGIDVPLPEQQS